jgi:hypothetical protein
MSRIKISSFPIIIYTLDCIFQSTKSIKNKRPTEIYYRMNYLDLLPNDVTKIVNRKVQDLQKIERGKERKENRKMNRAKTKSK